MKGGGNGEIRWRKVELKMEETWRKGGGKLEERRKGGGNLEIRWREVGGMVEKSWRKHTKKTPLKIRNEPLCVRQCREDQHSDTEDT